MESTLTGKRALVCGSSQGIGRAAAEALAAAGASITLLARNRVAMETVRRGLSGNGHEVLVADFDDPEAAGDVVSAHLEEFGPQHILINNSGGPPGGPCDYRRALWRRALPPL